MFRWPLGSGQLQLYKSGLSDLEKPGKVGKLDHPLALLESGLRTLNYSRQGLYYRTG
jgi:hypothetical protein